MRWVQTRWNRRRRPPPGDRSTPAEWAASVWELFFRSWLWVWWLATVVIAGAAALAARFHHVNISKHTWIYLLIAGSAVSVLRAFHLVRLERDQARRGPVGGKHLEQLTGSFSGLRVNIARNDPCYYGPGDATTAREAFRVHYAELVEELDAWDAVVVRHQATYASWAGRLAREASVRGMIAPDFEVGRIISAITAITESRLTVGKTHAPLQLAWSGHRESPLPNALPRVDWLTPVLNGNDPWIVTQHDDAESDQDWGTRIKPLTDIVDQWAADSQSWPELGALIAMRSERADAMVKTLEVVHLSSHREVIRTDPRCLICKVNEL